MARSPASTASASSSSPPPTVTGKRTRTKNPIYDDDAQIDFEEPRPKKKAVPKKKAHKKKKAPKKMATKKVLIEKAKAAPVEKAQAEEEAEETGNEVETDAEKETEAEEAEKLTFEEEDAAEAAKFPPLPPSAVLSSADVQEVKESLLEDQSTIDLNGDDDAMYELSNHFDILVYAMRALLDSFAHVATTTSQSQGTMAILLLTSVGIDASSHVAFIASLEMVKTTIRENDRSNRAVAKLETLKAFITLVVGNKNTADKAMQHASKYYLDISVARTSIALTFKKKTPAQVEAEIEAARVAAIVKAKKDKLRAAEKVKSDRQALLDHQARMALSQANREATQQRQQLQREAYERALAAAVAGAAGR